MSKNLKNNRDAGKIKVKWPYLANSYVSLYKPTKNVLRKYTVLKKLQINKDILIVRPDNENGVGFVDRWLYMFRMYDIANDMSRFLKLLSDSKLRREGKLQIFLCTLKIKDLFTKEQYDNEQYEYKVPLRRIS